MCGKSLSDLQMKTTSCCGKHFCQSCLQPFASPGKPCPHCGERELSFSPDAAEENREIGEVRVEVRCSMSARGCGWKGTMEDCQQHLAENCDFVDELCPNSCGGRVQRQELPAHLAAFCPRRHVRGPNELKPLGSESDFEFEEWDVVSLSEVCKQVHEPEEEIKQRGDDSSFMQHPSRFSSQSHGQSCIHSLLEQLNHFSCVCSVGENDDTGSLLQSTIYLGTFSGSHWCPNFYSSKYSPAYHMQLDIYGSHHPRRGGVKELVAHAYILWGEHDDRLEWPLNAVIDVEVYDPSKRNCSVIKRISGTWERVSRPHSRRGNKQSLTPFLTRSELDKYLRNDFLYLRILDVMILQSRASLTL